MIPPEERDAAILAVAHSTIKLIGALNNTDIEDTDIDEEAVKHLAESMTSLSEGAIQFAKARREDAITKQQIGRDEADNRGTNSSTRVR